MQKKILIIDDHDDLASALKSEYSKRDFDVWITENREDAIETAREQAFDVVITDLDGSHLGTKEVEENKELVCLPDYVEGARSNYKAFKICLTNLRSDQYSEEEVEFIVGKALAHKANHIDRGPEMKDRHERIDFVVPSLISLMEGILDYLMKRVEKLGVVKPEKSNLFVALDEAFVNAVKHGNKFDMSKRVRISVDLSPEEARFTIEDEGEGFDVNNIPDPRDPENLFKDSGRGVMFIYNIMDEVTYNSRGNRLTMVKLPEAE